MSKNWNRPGRRILRMLEIVFFIAVGLGILAVLGWLVVELLGEPIRETHVLKDLSAYGRCRQRV